MTERPWHLITGEYPPQSGGVSDYTAVLARALAAAGCEVHVWAPAVQGAAAGGSRVHVHRLADGFSDAGLHALTAELDRLPGPHTILVQYVAQAFGARGMNVGFCRWVQHRAREHRGDVRVMFHEPFYPFTVWPLQRNVLALVNRMMAVLLLSDIRVAYVSTEAWQRRLRRYAPRARRFVWLPIASSAISGPTVHWSRNCSNRPWPACSRSNATCGCASSAPAVRRWRVTCARTLPTGGPG